LFSSILFWLVPDVSGIDCDRRRQLIRVRQIFIPEPVIKPQSILYDSRTRFPKYVEVSSIRCLLPNAPPSETSRAPSGWQTLSLIRNTSRTRILLTLQNVQPLSWVKFSNPTRLPIAEVYWRNFGSI
jgi:nuclear pore complex protein Nup107